MIVTFEDIPPVRYDALPWMAVRVERRDVTPADPDADPPTDEIVAWQSAATDTIVDLDADPTTPALRRVIFTGAADETYRLVWVDAAAGESAPSDMLTTIAGGPLCTVDQVSAVLKLSKGPPVGTLELCIRAASDAIRAFTKIPFGLTRPVPALVEYAAIQQAASWYLIDSSRLADSFQNEMGDSAPGPRNARGLMNGVRDTIQPFRSPTIG